MTFCPFGTSNGGAGETFLQVRLGYFNCSGAPSCSFMHVSIGIEKLNLVNR
jgi:hypothetical protein